MTILFVCLSVCFSQLCIHRIETTELICCPIIGLYPVYRHFLKSAFLAKMWDLRQLYLLHFLLRFLLQLRMSFVHQLFALNLVNSWFSEALLKCSSFYRAFVHCTSVRDEQGIRSIFGQAKNSDSYEDFFITLSTALLSRMSPLHLWPSSIKRRESFVQIREISWIRHVMSHRILVLKLPSECAAYCFVVGVSPH